MNAFGPEPPGHWRGVADHPTRWLREYAAAASVVWEHVEPLWRRADPLLRREIDRVAIAAARRQHEVLLSQLAGKISYADGSLYLPDTEPETYELDGRPLVLVPMLSGPRSVIANFDRPDVVWIAYPLPGQGRLDTLSAPDCAADAVETILGRHRAAILRFLDVPVHMSAMAERLHYTPSTLTHHCDRLVEAGLIARERRGRQMMVSRTDRGTALLDLLSGD